MKAKYNFLLRALAVAAKAEENYVQKFVCRYVILKSNLNPTRHH